MKHDWEIKRLDDACEVEYGTRVVQKKDGGKIYPVYGLSLIHISEPTRPY